MPARPGVRQRTLTEAGLPRGNAMVEVLAWAKTLDTQLLAGGVPLGDGSCREVWAKRVCCSVRPGRDSARTAGQPSAVRAGSVRRSSWTSARRR
jgi:hypothetical protein